MPDMTPEQAHWFRAGIEAAARLHDRLAEWAYEAEEDPKCGQMHRDFAERIRALAPAAPEPSEAAIRRLEEERHELKNSFGTGAYHDGKARDRISQIDAELAARKSQHAAPEPSDAEVERVARAVEPELDRAEMVLTDPLTLKRLKAQRIARAALAAMQGEV